MRIPYDAILFDFDGVLVDSEPIHFACWNEVLAPFGIVLEWPQYREHFVGWSDRAMIRYLCGIATPPVPFEQMWACYPSKSEVYRSRMKLQSACAAETVELIRDLSHQPLAVVSSSPRIDVEPLLELAGIRQYFPVLVCNEDVSKHKPDPEPYRAAAAQLAVKRPLVVEDSEAGLQSARAAGFDVVHVTDSSKMAGIVRRHLSNGG